MKTSAIRVSFAFSRIARALRGGFALLCVAVAVSQAIEPTWVRILLLASGASGLWSMKIDKGTVRALLGPPSRHPLTIMPVGEIPGDLGWSYGEVRQRILAELRIQIRGILALTSLLVIVQILIGMLWMAASPFILIAVEANLLAAIVLGLHLGWRVSRALRAERRLVIR